MDLKLQRCLVMVLRVVLDSLWPPGVLTDLAATESRGDEKNFDNWTANRQGSQLMKDERLFGFVAAEPTETPLPLEFY